MKLSAVRLASTTIVAIENIFKKNTILFYLIFFLFLDKIESSLQTSSINFFFTPSLYFSFSFKFHCIYFDCFPTKIIRNASILISYFNILFWCQIPEKKKDGYISKEFLMELTVLLGYAAERDDLRRSSVRRLNVYGIVMPWCCLAKCLFYESTQNQLMLKVLRCFSTSFFFQLFSICVLLLLLFRFFLFVI